MTGHASSTLAGIGDFPGKAQFDLDYKTEYGIDATGYAGTGFACAQVVIDAILLEKKDDIKRRLEEAAKFAPLDQLAVSPQCGFASTEEGNILSEEEQWAKLSLAVEVANEVWGK